MLDIKIKSSPPLPIYPSFLDKLDTYKRRYKSSAAGAIHNIVGTASSKEPRCRCPASGCGAVSSLLDSSS
jgi:hypothetical protein